MFPIHIPSLLTHHNEAQVRSWFEKIASQYRRKAPQITFLTFASQRSSVNPHRPEVPARSMKRGMPCTHKSYDENRTRRASKVGSGVVNVVV